VEPNYPPSYGTVEEAAAAVVAAVAVVAAPVSRWHPKLAVLQ